MADNNAINADALLDTEPDKRSGNNAAENSSDEGLIGPKKVSGWVFLGGITTDLSALYNDVLTDFV